MNTDEFEYRFVKEENDRLANALLWIRYIAGMHYLGQAFEPDHMRALANLATDALVGKEQPNFVETQEGAMKKAEEWHKQLIEDGVLEE